MKTNHFESENSLEMSHLVEENDTNHVSGLSTILVATIQEAKDRISQVEYIFCSQLYPNFQKNSKCAQKLYAEARAIAEEEWKERVNDLEKLLTSVSVEKERALEDSMAARTEKMKLLEKVSELEEIVVTKTKEVDLNSSLVIIYEKQMKEQDEKMNLLHEQFREQEEKAMLFRKKLLEKDEELNKAEKSAEEMTRKINAQVLNISSREMMLSNSEKEKKQLGIQLENMEASLGGLKNKLIRKTVEVQEVKQLQEQLVEQVNRNEIELRKKDQLIGSYEKEKQVLLSRVNCLEKKAEDGQDNLRNGISEMPNISVLAKQLELKLSELLVESQKRRDVVAAYKKLKSQQNFLLKKLGLSNEEMLLKIKAEEASDQLSDDNKTSTSFEVKIENQVRNECGSELCEVKKEVDSIEDSDDDISGRLNQMSNSHSPARSTSPTSTNCPVQRKPGPSGGIKRPASGWRETRSRQIPGGADPHDDFLDTPFDNIKGNLLNARLADSVNSDDETQDMTRTKPGPDKQVQKAPRIGPKDFKFVEPVRKKAERENLNGIECKQCKKFYDAVLGDAEDKDGGTSKQSHRCEHHDGVSRHRYRYIPPMTPEGFWNIGFDTEN